MSTEIVLGKKTLFIGKLVPPLLRSNMLKVLRGTIKTRFAQNDEQKLIRFSSKLVLNHSCCGNMVNNLRITSIKEPQGSRFESQHEPLQGGKFFALNQKVVAMC